MTDQQLDLDAIEARANAATEGPWEEYPEYGAHFYAYLRGPYMRGVGTLNFGDGEGAEADREFVKHAREDVAALVAEVRRLHAELAARPADATEYGIRIPDGTVLRDGWTFDRRDQEARLERYRDCWPEAVLVQRTVHYGDWTETGTTAPAARSAAV